MLYGEVDRYRVEDIPGCGTSLVAEVTTHPYDESPEREFDAYLAKAGNFGPYRTKLHELGPMYPTGFNLNRQLIQWQAYGERFKGWLAQNREVDGHMLLDWVGKRRREGSVQLDEWITAVNLALIDGLGTSLLAARLGGAAFLTRPQIAAGAPLSVINAGQDEMDVVAFNLKENNTGDIDGAVYCFDTYTRRIAVVGLRQAGLRLYYDTPADKPADSDV